MLRTGLVTCALLGVVATAAGCGGVPGGAVATIEGEAISRESFDHWLAVLARSGGRADAELPKPPAYEACISEKRAAAKGGAKLTDAQAKEQCRREYHALRDQALQLLISFRWIEGEAEERGISVEDADVRESFEQLKRQSFPEDADYRKFLTASGQTEQDLLMRVRYDMLSNKIREQVTKGKEEVAEARIAEYYKANRGRFAEPERRDLQVVVTRTRAKAEQALAALAAGRSWASVAREYSIDRTTRARAGKLPAVRRGEQPKALDRAIFDAAKGTISGPVKAPAGYYVFEVTRTQAAHRQTLEQARPTIEQLLAAEGQQKALEGYLDEFRREWRAKTECGEGYVTADCKNGPEVAERTAAAGSG